MSVILCYTTKRVRIKSLKLTFLLSNEVSNGISQKVSLMFKFTISDSVMFLGLLVKNPINCDILLKIKNLTVI